MIFYTKFQVQYLSLYCCNKNFSNQLTHCMFQQGFFKPINHLCVGFLKPLVSNQRRFFFSTNIFPKKKKKKARFSQITSPSTHFPIFIFYGKYFFYPKRQKKKNSLNFFSPLTTNFLQKPTCSDLLLAISSINLTLICQPCPNRPNKLQEGHPKLYHSVLLAFS